MVEVNGVRGIEQLAEEVARHLWYAKACCQDGNINGTYEHIADALLKLGYPKPEDVGLSSIALNRNRTEDTE